MMQDNADTAAIILKLGGSRLVAAADWMVGHPAPEEVDEESRDWADLGVDVINGDLVVPARFLADFIADCEDGAEQVLDMAEGLDDDDRRDARATSKALLTIAERLQLIDGTPT